MKRRPISYIEFKFPAPVCDDCGIPMVTVRTILHHDTLDEVTFVSYRCPICRFTFGEPRKRLANHGRRSHSGFTQPA
jgi:hypothetical protein